MTYKMRTKLAVSFVITAFTSVIMIGIFSNVLLEKHFKEYVYFGQEKENQEIVELIGSKVTRDGIWDVQSIEDVGIYAMKRGLILKVSDRNNVIVWDAYTTLSEDSQSIMNKDLRNYFDVTRENYQIKKGEDAFGTVEIAYYGSVNYNDIDIHFIQTLNMVFGVVGLFSLLLAMIVGIILSDRISKPIIRVISKAKSIAGGTYEDRSIETSTTHEINELISTINELAEYLETQEILRKRLTGDVAHELRTPLATVLSHLEAMIDGIWDPTPERLSSCYEEITRITRLVSDLEKLAHYESESLILTRTEFVAKDFLELVIQTFEAQFTQLGITPIVDCDASHFLADKDKLSQVFINLISNALKFTPYGGSITFVIKGTDQSIQAMISDTGQGITPQDLPHIFERFYRADVSRNRTTGGTGIGLTLVKTIVEAHGGTIEVSSEVLEGTQFKMSFPK